MVRRLEGRLTVKEGIPASDISPGRLAVHLINERLTQATDDVLDKMTLDELAEHVNKAANAQQQMYYI